MACRGFCVSSPRAPAPSNPANARKPNTEPRTSACTLTPDGRVKMLPVSVPPFSPWPCPTFTTMTTMQPDDQRDGDRLDVEQGPGRPLDHPGAEPPDDHGDRQRQPDPVGPLPPAQVLQHPGQEVAGGAAEAGTNTKYISHIAQPENTPMPRAERGADEAVDRPGVVVLPGQQHVPVADEAAGHAREHERQRGPAADQGGHARRRRTTWRVPVTSRPRTGRSPPRRAGCA